MRALPMQQAPGKHKARQRCRWPPLSLWESLTANCDTKMHLRLMMPLREPLLKFPTCIQIG
jgi:hypothetical protein